MMFSDTTRISVTTASSGRERMTPSGPERFSPPETLSTPPDASRAVKGSASRSSGAP